MRFIGRLQPNPRLGKPALVLAITAVSSAVALLLCLIPFVRVDLNDTFYDYAYHLRRAPDGRNSPVVIVVANDDSLKHMYIGGQQWGWPWPRTFWADAIQYVQDCGAKAAVVDILFSEPSVYNHELGDDKAFATAMNALKIPVIYADWVGDDGSRVPIVPPIQNPIRGDARIETGGVLRNYEAGGRNLPSLALQAVRSLSLSTPPWADQPFRLRYYGKHLYGDGHTTYPFVAADQLIMVAEDPSKAKEHGIDPALFKDKIVLFGATALAATDLKSSPLDKIYPGVEIHATAIENLLEYQRVKMVGWIGVVSATVLFAVLAAVAAALPGNTAYKLILSALVAAALASLVVILFVRDDVVWLPTAGPLLAVGISVLLALAWSYFVEDREARFFVRALGQYVSPHVADELKKDPKKLAISAERRELTILFSDIAGFTDLSERLEEGIGPILNFYLDELSQPVWSADGTIDKYIGDAIMAFWNAPMQQPNHARSACRAALAMKQRLAEIQPQLAELGAPGLSSRIGINTGTCTFGNMGSSAKFNYSVIGDACNFASRLEAANKFYHTPILIGEATANAVKDDFTLRKVDVMRVQGKQRPIAVYELFSEGQSDAATLSLIARYEKAFGHYCRSEWDAAERILLEVVGEHPQDGPSRELLSRVNLFRVEPPPANWDGVFVAREK
jgi:adenylate cyclase